MAGPSISGIALVIGAAGGIGQETAFAFAEGGVAAVVFADINEQAAKETAEKSKTLSIHPNYRTLVVHVDVTDPISVQRMVETTVKELGRIDHSVNAAGIGNDVLVPIYDSAVDQFDNVMNVNAKGVLTCTRAVSKVMMAQEPRSVETRNGKREVGKGAIVNIGSANSYVALPGKVAYVTSKHAVMGITKTAALDCASHGVRVNAVCPTWVRTPMLEEECQKNPEVHELIKGMSPLARAAEPEEVSGIITFLCSDNASYVTGTGLLIDAGLTLSVHLT